jgi:hypothetical protein
MKTDRLISVPHKLAATPSPKRLDICYQLSISNIVYVCIGVFYTKVVELLGIVSVMNIEYIVNIYAIIGLNLFVCGVPYDTHYWTERVPRRFPYEESFFG